MNESIIKHFKLTFKKFVEITEFSNEPGIYALFFCGEQFPIPNYQPKCDEIIYIGKTESSQKQRDANTHFADGKTGSSTLRKTFGSLLYTNLNLIPIPRSQSDIDKKRHAHFKFDNKSEKKITNWMSENLGLAFYPYPKSKTEIDLLETNLIKELVPICNIDRKNIVNPFYDHIRSLRKGVGQIAFDSVTVIGKVTTIIERRVPIIPNTNRSSNIDIHSHKYELFWKLQLPFILDSNNK